MTRRLCLLSLALVAVLASACGRYLTTGVAVVNGEMISRDALDKQVASVYDNPQFQGAINPDDVEQRLQIERQVIVQLIQDEVIRQEGKRLKVSITAAQVDARFQAIAAAQPDQLSQEVQARGEAAVRDLIRGQLLAEKLAEVAGGAAAPTEQELRAAYGNGRQFEQLRVRHILFQVSGQDESGARAKAQSALNKLKDGADFAALAKQVSEDPGSKEQGGDLGLVTRATQFDETFLNAAFAVKTGQISGLVRTQFGFHIIKVDSRTTKTFEQARAELVDQLTTAKRTEAFQTFVVERLRAADIRVNPRWGDFDPETFRIETRQFFVPPSPEPETQAGPLGG